MNVKKILGAAVASVMAISTMAVAANAATAGLAFQTDSFGFRNSILQSKGGWDDQDAGEWVDFETWTVKDATIDGDGQYTASFEFSNDNGGKAWNVLRLCTDISAVDYPDVKITVDKMTIDGTDVTAGAQATELSHEKIDADKYADEGKTVLPDVYTINFINTWASVTNIDPSAFGTKVEITFTVSGLGSAGNTDDEGNTGNEGDTTTAPDNGNTNTPTDDKNTPDTGVEGVAVVAGLAIVAAGAVVVAKKRK